ncbi:OST-HTH/LOTUS domain-containing protein [Sorangium sp. So ce119]|uniref:P-loop NTPase n=1 Tax=Sorangium sp. So ce119 TaxID=3133279 RepID=UPI003F5EA206
MKVDVRGAKTLESGQYILKLIPPPKWEDQEDEITAHLRAVARAEEFASVHVPRLVRHFTATGPAAGTAMLLEIAGRSMDSYISASGRESDHFLRVCKKLTGDLLIHWVAREPARLCRPHELLEALLDYRLVRSRAPRLHDFIENKLGQHLLGMFAKRVVVNPLSLYKLAKEQSWGEQHSLPALLHGDLHAGNIFVHRHRPEQNPYWVIDFGLSREGLAGYDQAYMEVAQILECLRDSDPASLATLLEDLDAPGRDSIIPPGAAWLKDCLGRMRAVMEKWVDDQHGRRADDLNRQLLLTRVAAGLNWANKPLSDPQRSLALYYAAWAARIYLERHEPSVWAAREERSPVSAATGTAVDQALWKEFWDTVEGFSIKAGRFVLVAEALGESPSLRALGQLPWSVVIDLDPYSDEKGLHRHAAPLLEARRSVHTFSRALIPSDFSRGTAWMMSAGWALKREGPTDFNTWRYDNMHLIRLLVRSLEDAVKPDPLYVLVLPGASLDGPMERVAEVVSAFDEMTRGRVRTIVLGPSPLSERIKHKHIPLDVAACVGHLESLFGVSVPGEAPQLPGANGILRRIPLDVLRSFEENLEVMHSRVIEDMSGAATTKEDRDSFWRGRPPTWEDFREGVDIERSLHDRLVSTLREKLSESRNQTVVLYHMPGAGGTTTALRAAWDLHREHPTAVLRTWSAALTTRLQSLYNLAERPVLLVADAAVLTESAREDLYRELSQRNCRVVLLYVRRVINRPEEDCLCLPDPMHRDEAKSFYDSYVSLCDEQRRRKELERITLDDNLSRYRSPFFYGLIVFERDFQPIERYIASHIHGVRGRAREVLQYLALVTIYSDAGLHEGIFRQLMGVSENSKLSVADLLPEGPARLVTRRQERLRLMHQILAEETLAALSGGAHDEWRLDLAELAVHFIREVTSLVHPDAQSVRDLFRQLFVERQGGGESGAEDRMSFSPLIEEIDAIDRKLGHRVLKTLAEHCPSEAHFFNHLGRHQIYRIRHDIDKAEEYLQQAIRLSPDDYIHYHTYGLVLRARIRDRMKASKKVSTAELLRDVTDLFTRATEMFEKTRAASPENIYGYITHVQMILEIAQQLKMASGVDNIARIDSEASGWVFENIAAAQRLLDDAANLYGTLDRNDSYLTECLADLQRLYGNIDDVIAIWELAHAQGTVNAASRRALANAYLSRNGRKWSMMQQAELRRIMELMELNLSAPSSRDEDYHLWFEAYKLLPEFDLDEALGRLGLWAKRFPSWRAHYYLYVLYFLLWFTGRTNETAEMERALERCRNLVYGRRTASPQWLGHVPNGCPLVSSSDLGAWSRSDNFWSETGALRPINGVIDEHIHGPQAAHIVIDGKVRVFFVPGKDFFPGKDENKPVNFFLGFSPEGPRAWRTRPGWLEHGDRIRPGGSEPQVQLVVPPPLTVSDELKELRVRELRAERVREFISDVIAAKTGLGVSVALSEVEARAEAAFGVDGLLKSLGLPELRDLLPSDAAYQIDQDGSELFVSSPTARRVPPSMAGHFRVRGKVVAIHREGRCSYGFINDGSKHDYHFYLTAVVAEHRDRIAPGAEVEFIPESRDASSFAIGVRVVGEGRQIEGGELKEAAEELVRQLLREAPEQSLALKDVKMALEREFPGRSLVERLGVVKISAFLNSIPGVSVAGKHPNLVVRSRERVAPAFGRLPQKTWPMDHAKQRQRATSKAVASGANAQVDKAQGNRTRNPLREAGKAQSMKHTATKPDFAAATPGRDDSGLRAEVDAPAAPDTAAPEVSQAPCLATADGSSFDRKALCAEVTDATRKLIHEAPGGVLPATRLGHLLTERFPGEGKLVERLGYATLSRFLQTIPEIEIVDDGTGRMVRWRSHHAPRSFGPQQQK